MIRPAAALASVASGLLLASLTGCPTIVLQPPPDSPIAGTWELQTASGEPPGRTLYVFTTRGDIESITYEVENVRIINTTIPSDTTVNGSAVVVQTGPPENRLVFSGILSDDGSRIDGDLTTRLSAGGTTIEIDNGAAALVRLE